MGWVKESWPSDRSKPLRHRDCSIDDTHDFGDSGDHLPRGMSYAYFKLSAYKAGLPIAGNRYLPGLCGTGWVLAPNAPQPSL